MILVIIPYSLDVSYVEPKRPYNTFFRSRKITNHPTNEKKTKDEDKNGVLIDQNQDLSLDSMIIVRLRL